FAAELKKPVSNISLATTPVTISANTTMSVVQPVTSAPSMNIAVTAPNGSEWAGKFVRIENLWQAGQRINIEKGPLVSTVIDNGAWSAQWVIKPVPGTKYFWIENRWKGGRLNIEKGPLESSAIGDNAWSAHWELKKIGPNLYWIENRWRTGQRINVEKGVLESTVISDGANSAMWYIRQAVPPPQNLRIQAN
ncbi:MAG: hypothetical protein H7Y01_01325, partial [Ferruginibacter sp.]|nr:hypothetical protein [Chitinophagaceae bacterium]